MIIYILQESRNNIVAVEVKDSLQLALTTYNLISENGKDRNLINHLHDSLEVIHERSALR